MDTPKFESLNAFFLEDPDEPGKMRIPMVVIEGEQIILSNIKEDKIDFFKAIMGAIAKQANTKAYFTEYEQPTSVVEIEQKEMPGMMGIFAGKGNLTEIGDVFEKITGLVDELMAKRGYTPPKKIPDEDTVH